MFGFLKKKAPIASMVALHRQYPLAAALDDQALVMFLRQMFAENKPVVGALFLVAFENFPAFYYSFQRVICQSTEYEASIDGMIGQILDSHAQLQDDSVANEVNRRRCFYIYAAALLTTAHTRARANPALWDEVADVWVYLMPGARVLRSTLDRTSLWESSEIEFFDIVRMDEDGEKIVEQTLMPPEIRYHAKLNEWREQDLSPDVRAELAEMKRLFRGK